MYFWTAIVYLEDRDVLQHSHQALLLIDMNDQGIGTSILGASLSSLIFDCGNFSAGRALILSFVVCLDRNKID